MMFLCVLKNVVGCERVFTYASVSMVGGIVRVRNSFTKNLLNVFVNELRLRSVQLQAPFSEDWAFVITLCLREHHRTRARFEEVLGAGSLSVLDKLNPDVHQDAHAEAVCRGTLRARFQAFGAIKIDGLDLLVKATILDMVTIMRDAELLRIERGL
jgi:hypothetical protein